MSQVASGCQGKPAAGYRASPRFQLCQPAREAKEKWWGRGVPENCKSQGMDRFRWQRAILRNSLSWRQKSCSLPFSASASPAADPSPLHPLLRINTRAQIRLRFSDLPETTETQWLALEPESSAGPTPRIRSAQALSIQNQLLSISTPGTQIIRDHRGRNDKLIWGGRHTLVM